MWNAAVDFAINRMMILRNSYPGMGVFPEWTSALSFSVSYDDGKQYITYYNVPKADGFYNITLPADCDCPGVIDDLYNYGFRDYEYEEVLRFRRTLSGVKHVRFLDGGAEYAGEKGSLIIYPYAKEVFVGSTAVPFDEFNEVLEEENNIDELVEFFSF